jgi:hypothetical protein
LIYKINLNVAAVMPVEIYVPKAAYLLKLTLKDFGILKLIRINV